MRIDRYTNHLWGEFTVMKIEKKKKKKKKRVPKRKEDSQEKKVDVALISNSEVSTS